MSIIKQASKASLLVTVACNQNMLLMRHDPLCDYDSSFIHFILMRNDVIHISTWFQEHSSLLTGWVCLLTKVLVHLIDGHSSLRKFYLKLSQTRNPLFHFITREEGVDNA